MTTIGLTINETVVLDTIRIFSTLGKAGATTSSGFSIDTIYAAYNAQHPGLTLEEFTTIFLAAARQGVFWQTGAGFYLVNSQMGANQRNQVFVDALGVLPFSPGAALCTILSGARHPLFTSTSQGTSAFLSTKTGGLGQPGSFVTVCPNGTVVGGCNF